MYEAPEENMSKGSARALAHLSVAPLLPASPARWLNFDFNFIFKWLNSTPRRSRGTLGWKISHFRECDTRARTPQRPPTASLQPCKVAQLSLKERIN